MLSVRVNVTLGYRTILLNNKLEQISAYGGCSPALAQKYRVQKPEDIYTVYPKKGGDSR